MEQDFWVNLLFLLELITIIVVALVAMLAVEAVRVVADKHFLELARLHQKVELLCLLRAVVADAQVKILGMNALETHMLEVQVEQP
jgi:hypothetical protein